MTDNVRLVEGLANDRMKQARQRIKKAQQTGEMLQVHDIVAARGLVLGERENSIFSDAWVPLAVLFLIVGFFLNRNLACMSLGTILLLVVGLSSWWKTRALNGVFYGREFDRTHIFPGEPIHLTVQAINHKSLPLTWLQFQDHIQGPVRIISDRHAPLDSLEEFTLVTSFTMRPYEQQERRVTLLFTQRGYYQVGPVRYQAGDPFTLFALEREHDARQMLVVYPKVWPLVELGLPAKEPFGDLRIPRSLFTDPIKMRGIRDYQPQDRFRDIHWKATARRGELQTKIFEPSTGMTMVVFLNVSTGLKFWMGTDPELLERLVAVTASVLNHGAEQKWGIGVYANGTVPRSDQGIKVRPSRSPNQLLAVLEALAAVTGFATGGIEQLMRRESPELPWAATMVLVTAVVTDEMIATLMQLREAGRRVVLISLDDEPPPATLGRILTYHIPATVPAFQQSLTARTITEASLQAVPTPEPVKLEAI